MMDSGLSGSELGELESAEFYIKGCARVRKDRTVSVFVSSYFICVATE